MTRSDGLLLPYEFEFADRHEAEAERAKWLAMDGGWSAEIREDWCDSGIRTPDGHKVLSRVYTVVVDDGYGRS